jgi:two-component system sensor histidine kinase KdpD
MEDKGERNSCDSEPIRAARKASACARDRARRASEPSLPATTRISSEGIRPHNEWVDPGDIINAAIDRKARLLAGRELRVVIEDDLPLVRVDPGLIERALEHLIENAVKYSPPASPIEVRAERSNGTVRLVVKDNGVGLSPDEQGRIWERFYRSPRLRDRIGGSGLGL